MSSKRSPIFIIFTTVFVDLIGFGMVIPLIGLYGRHYGATGFQLPILGGIYSLMQFFCAPIWGSISDRVGRRPVLLISLTGSTLSYLLFGLAPNYTWLLIARALGGVFAANISTAQAYIADITTPQDRAKGMGLIGAAFGIGFTLGPPLGGFASSYLGLAAPGLIAALICGINAFLAVFRLPETLPSTKRKKNFQLRFLNDFFSQLIASLRSPKQAFLFLAFFAVTFAFSTMEQTFPLLFQVRFNFGTGEAGLKTGLILMVAGILGAFIQGKLIKQLVPRYGESKLLWAGLVFNALAMLFFPFAPSFSFYFLIAVLLAFGSGLINPNLSALISKNASSSEQGTTLGLSQGLGSLARALGPFCGLLTFGIRPELPFLIAAGITVIIFLSSLRPLGLVKQ